MELTLLLCFVICQKCYKEIFMTVTKKAETVVDSTDSTYLNFIPLEAGLIAW